MLLARKYSNVMFTKVLGHKEGLNVMEKADPLFLLIGLPTIPLILILSKMVRWEDYFLRLWRKHSPKLPVLSYLLGSGITLEYNIYIYSHTFFIHYLPIRYWYIYPTQNSTIFFEKCKYIHVHVISSHEALF